MKSQLLLGATRDKRRARAAEGSEQQSASHNDEEPCWKAQAAIEPKGKATAGTMMGIDDVIL